MIRYIGTDDAYEPYQGETYTIEMPDAAGTVYGGTLTVNDDGTGSLVVDKGITILNGAEQTASIIWGAYTCTLNTDQTYDLATVNVISCSHLKDGITGSAMYNSANNDRYPSAYSLSATRNLRIRNRSLEDTTLEGYKAWLAEEASKGTPVQIVY
jgi:hypothetical protein